MLAGESRFFRCSACEKKRGMAEKRTPLNAIREEEMKTYFLIRKEVLSIVDRERERFTRGILEEGSQKDEGKIIKQAFKYVVTLI